MRVLAVHRFLIDAQYVAITNIAAPVAADPDPPQPELAPSLPPLLSQLSQPNASPTSSYYHSSSASSHLPPSYLLSPPSDSGYDVVLGDGQHKTKCLLAPSFSPLVEQGGLLPGSIVCVYDCVRRFDETVVGGQGFVVVRGMAVKERGRTATLLGSGVEEGAAEQWASAEGSKEREYRPLLSSRSFYLNLWHDDSLDMPSPPPPAPDDTSAAFNLDDPSLHLITIVGALSGDYAGKEVLLCRVSGKSRLIRFGRAYSSGGGLVAGTPNPAPFMFEMLLIDATGCLKAAVWNSLASQLYRRLRVGQVLAVSRFRHRHHADTDEVELSLNPYNPAATVHTVPREQYATLSPPMPDVPYSIARLWEMRSLPDKKHADVMCEVGWAGRLEREWSRQYRQYFCYRWLLLQDGTAAQSLAVKLYCNSQDEQVAGVRRGEMVFVTSLQLTTTRDMIDSRERSAYAQTTQFSQLTREADLHSSDDPRLTEQLQQLQHFRASRSAAAPPLPSMWQWDVSFVSWEAKHSTDGRVLVTPVSEFRQLKDELRFMQHRTLLVQGVVTDVQLLPAGLRLAGEEGKEGEAEAEAAAEQPVKAKRSGRPRKRPANNGLAPSLPPAATASTSPVIPTSNATAPLLYFQLSDLNFEHHVRVQLADRPMPFSSVGVEGSALHAYRAIAEDGDAGVAHLPAMVRGLLELMPATAINGEEVERIVHTFQPAAPPAAQTSSARRPGRVNQVARKSQSTIPRVQFSHSQPVPPTARITRSQQSGRHGSRSLSQEAEPSKPATRTTRRKQQPQGSEGQERVDTEQAEDVQKGEAVEMSAEERQRLTSEAVSALLLNKQALVALSVYRSSYEVVEVGVTNLFSLLQQQDDAR